MVSDWMLYCTSSYFHYQSIALYSMLWQIESCESIKLNCLSAKRFLLTGGGEVKSERKEFVVHSSE